MVLHGTDPAQIKKYQVFKELQDAKITDQIEKILMLKCNQMLNGLPLDPFRLQSFTHGELILLRNFDPERWVDPKTGFLLVFPFTIIDRKNKVAREEAITKRARFLSDRRNFIEAFMKPSSKLIEVS
jgi:hypothetical protein